MAHRVAYKFLTGEEPETVDHQDTDTGNNRAENLRAATYGQNTANRRGWSKHGLPKGVYPYRQRFKANVTTGSGPTKKTIHLGVFDTPAEAHAAYCEAASAVHGEFFNPGPARPSVFD
jgi:hypothetical protein